MTLPAGFDEPLARGGWPYARVHATACVAVLRRWLGRWAVFAVVAALVASAGAGLDTALATVAALAAWAALPLVRGAAAGGGWAVLAVLGSAAVGVALLTAMRHALWPAAWREAERALPLTPRQTGRSDALVIAMAALPWATLQAVGSLVWLLQRPGWLVGQQAAVVVAGLLSTLLMLAGGLVLQRARRRGAVGPARRAARQGASAAAPALRVQRAGLAAWVLVAGRWCAVGPGARPGTPASRSPPPLCWAGPWCGGRGGSGVWLALQALVVQVGVSRARGLAMLELRPLGLACAALPLPPWHWRAGIDAVCAAPALLGAAGVATLVLACAPSARAPLLLVWWALLGFSAALDLRVPAADASVQAARWLFLLVVAVALGSEVLP